MWLLLSSSICIYIGKLILHRVKNDFYSDFGIKKVFVPTNSLSIY